MKQRIYKDLGLKSGTKWCTKYEDNGSFFTFKEALSKYDGLLPTSEEIQELVTQCKWSVKGGQLIARGPNGKYLKFPLKGYKLGDNTVDLNLRMSIWGTNKVRMSIWRTKVVFNMLDPYVLYGSSVYSKAAVGSYVSITYGFISRNIILVQREK